MIRPPDRLKSTANRLAELFCSSVGSRMLSLIGDLEQPPQTQSINCRSDSKSKPPKSPSIGIWQAEATDGTRCFVRQSERSHWGLWAQTPVIPINPASKRVLLLGESVARGFFYDPAFNPAMALQKILRSAANTLDIDVVDLARIGIGMDEMSELAGASPELQPDVLVLLAGNNWRPTVGITREDRQTITDILRRTEDWQDVRSYVERTLKTRTENFFTSLRDKVSSQGIKIVVIVPEFNLLDWREPCGPPLLLDSCALAAWIDLRQLAAKAFSQNELVACAHYASQILEIDGGSSAAGFSFLADVALARGQMTQARLFLEKARDVGIFLTRLETPRSYSVVQESIRAAAQRYDFSLVDLPTVFRDYLSGGIPDRRLFHDYCHLTAEGICLAMAAAAQAVLPWVGTARCPLNELQALADPLDSDTLAKAYFMAALHNANWDQGYDLVHHSCQRALEYSPAMAAGMEIYADLHVRRAPSVLCKSFDKAVNTQGLHALGFFHTPPRSPKSLNLPAINAISDSLGKIEPDRQKAVQELIINQHRISSEGLDLLELSYCSTSYAMPEGRWDESSTFYSAYDQLSHFTVICDSPRSLTLTIAYRTRSNKPLSHLYILVNGKVASTLSASSSWMTERLVVEANKWMQGENSIVLKWPLPEWSHSQRLEEACVKIESGQFAKAYAIFGELHTFRVSL